MQGLVHAKRPILAVIFFVTVIHATLASGSLIYAGSSYNQGCAFPADATPTGQCPQTQYDFATVGLLGFNLSQANDQPPVVTAGPALVRFGRVDQDLNTFSLTFRLVMFWDDQRGGGQIQNATAAARRSGGSCKKYCSKQGQDSQRGSCCDGLWLPTLSFQHIDQESFVLEDYLIASQPDYDGSGSNSTFYLLTMRAMFHHPFDWRAFPFDRHALSMLIVCMDCKFDSYDNYSEFYISGIIGDGSSTGIVSSSQSLPQSRGWQINGVHVAAVNFTTSSQHSVPNDRITAQDSIYQAQTNPDFYGMLFVLYTTRVTRAYFALLAIMPPIILVLVAFLVFTVSKADYVYRLLAHVLLLLPMLLCQVSNYALSPRSFRLLSIQILAFISLIMLPLLMAVAAISRLILNRRLHFQWVSSMKAGRKEWKAEKRRREEAVSTQSSQSSGKPPKRGDEDLAGQHSVTFQPRPQHLPTCGSITMEEKRRQREAQEQLDHAVRYRASKSRQGLWGFRGMGGWWSELALSDLEGYRERVALLWEAVALGLLFCFYLASVVALFAQMSSLGENPRTP